MNDVIIFFQTLYAKLLLRTVFIFEPYDCNKDVLALAVRRVGPKANMELTRDLRADWNALDRLVQTSI